MAQVTFLVQLSTASGMGLFFLALQFDVMLLHELPNLVSEIQQPFPLFDVKGHRHPLQAVDADGSFLADFAVQRPLLGSVCLLQKLRRLFDGDFASGNLGEDLFFGHSGLQVSSVLIGSFTWHSVLLFPCRVKRSEAGWRSGWRVKSCGF